MTPSAAATAESNPSRISGGADDAPGPKARRVWFVDILRLIASFQMINGHTLDAVMLTSIRQGVFYDRYLWVRGLVSVSFLAVAGISFHLSTLCRFERHKANPAAVRRRFRRALVIIGIGFLLNFPFGAFREDPESQRIAWYYFNRVGVLKCIGSALIILELLTLVARRPSQVVVGAAVLAAGFCGAAPLADALIADGASHPVLNWFSHQGGSMFPLFPWAGYVLAGLVLGAWALPRGGETPFLVTVRRLSLAFVVIAAASFVAKAVSFGVYDEALHHAATAPSKFLERLAAVIGLILVLAIASRPLKSLPELFRVLSSETLTIFAFHLIILFYPGFAIAERFDHTLRLPAALGVSAFMVVLTCSYTYAWHRVKRAWYLRQKAPRTV